MEKIFRFVNGFERTYNSSVLNLERHERFQYVCFLLHLKERKYFH